MQLKNSLELPLSADEAFTVLSDVQLVAGCVPGARVESRDGDSFVGTMQVKVGPMRFGYRGSGQLDRSPEERRLVLTATGESERDPGSVQASIALLVVPRTENSSMIEMETDLALTGRAAQFGGAVVQDVSNALIRTFGERLLATLTTPLDGSPARTSTTTSTPLPQTMTSPTDVEALSVFDMVPARTLRMAAGVAAGVALLGILAAARRPARLPAILPVVVVRTP